MENDVPLHSAEDQRLLSDAATARQILLIRIFRKRERSGYCGTQAAALLLSARHLGQKYPYAEDHIDCDVRYLPYMDTNLYSYPQTTGVLPDHETLLQIGVTLKQLQDLFIAHGVCAKRVHARHDGVRSHVANVKDFRTLAVAALSHEDSSSGVLVNFEFDMMWEGVMRTVGHCSLLAAYHTPTDRFLLLDTCPQAESRWIKAERMYGMMAKSADPVSGLKRGFIIIE